MFFGRFNTGPFSAGSTKLFTGSTRHHSLIDDRLDLSTLAWTPTLHPRKTKVVITISEIPWNSFTFRDKTRWSCSYERPRKLRREARRGSPARKTKFLVTSSWYWRFRWTTPKILATEMNTWKAAWKDGGSSDARRVVLESTRKENLWKMCLPGETVVPAETISPSEPIVTAVDGTNNSTPRSAQGMQTIHSALSGKPSLRD